MDRFLRGACEELKRTQGDQDTLADQPEFEQAWHLYLRQPEAVGTTDRRRAQRGALATLDRCLSLLEERGLVHEQKEGADAVYVPMERMRVMVATIAGHYAYETLARLRQAGVEATA